MKVAIKDANVLIDLEIAGLFDLWFQLGIETHTSVFIREGEELERGGHDQALGGFASGQVVCHEFDFKEIVLVEHLQGLLGGQAKAMVVTPSRLEAVRYKLAFDKYIARLGYKDIRAVGPDDRSRSAYCLLTVK